MTDEPDTAELENRIDELEETIQRMLPSRREVIGMGAAGLAGAGLMSGTASAGTNQVGTIGSASQPVDLESEDINNADTVTTQDLIVNGAATGPFGGGGVVLEAGDTITVETISNDDTDETFLTLYDGNPKDVLGGVMIDGSSGGDFLYTFSDNSTIHKNGTGTTYDFGNNSLADDSGGDNIEINFLPAALDVTKIEVGHNSFQGRMGVEVILKD